MAHAASTLRRDTLGLRIAGVRRAALLRRVHVLIGLVFWTVFLRDGGATDTRTLTCAVVLAAGWWGWLEVTVLHDSRRLRSTSLAGVQFAGAALGYVVGVLALSTAVEFPASDVRLVAGCLELGALAFLWQAGVVGGMGLGRPLRCLLIGSPATARLLLREPLAPGAHAFELVGLVDDRAEAADAERAGVRLLGRVDDLDRLLARDDLDVLVIGARTGRPGVFARLLAAPRLAPGVVELPEFFERQFGRVPVDEINSAWFLDALRPGSGGVAVVAKRAVDIAVAGTLAALTAPVLLAAMALVRLTSPGPALFHQPRVGANGRVFTVWKLRSMRLDAEPDGPVWAAEDDPRVTPIGKHLRRFRIDELPQFWNVLRGEMTMVGPRPERPEFVRELVEAVPFYEPRHLTKPGLTGWAQVSAGYAATLDDARLKLSYDLYYLKHRGVALDLAILVRTIGVVLRGTGAR